MGRTLTLVIAIVFMVTACNGATTDTDGSSPSESSGGSQTSQTDDSLAGGADTTEAATETTETSAPVSGGGDGGECTINVSGDLEETIVYPQSAFTFASDYWASEEELREVIEFFGEDNSGGSYEEIVASGEPILGWFMFNCVDPDDPGSGVVVLPTNDTTSELMPMGPGTYPVTGGLFDATGPVGTVIANFGLNAEEQFSPVEGTGDLVITTWDSDLLEGTISFDAVEALFEGDAREISVVVEFSVLP